MIKLIIALLAWNSAGLLFHPDRVRPVKKKEWTQFAHHAPRCNASGWPDTPQVKLYTGVDPHKQLRMQIVALQALRLPRLAQLYKTVVQEARSDGDKLMTLMSMLVERRGNQAWMGG